MNHQPDKPDVRQVLVHPVVWPHLEAWLAARGIELARIPVGDDDLPTYAMTPTDAAAARPDDTTAAPASRPTPYECAPGNRCHACPTCWR